MTKARPRRGRDEIEIDDVSWRYLCDATTPEDEAEHGWLLHTLEFDELELAIVQPPTGKRTSELWTQYGAEIVAWWAKENPGTRPLTWWKYSAPEPRLRVGGTGVTKREIPWIRRLGLPDPEGFVLPDDMRLLPFRDSGVSPVDFDDPPAFESEAAYLRRLDLLQPGEAKRLSARDFLPYVMTKAELTAAVERRRLWNERGTPRVARNLRPQW